jgi:hypothetical protein
MTAAAIDPALQLAARGAVALLFAAAAAHKLRDVGAFRSAVEAYELMPRLWVVPVSALLIGAEVGIAAGCLLPRVGPVAAAAAAALLSVYAGAIAVNLQRGRRDIDCGCAGPSRRQPLSAWLVGRNALLVAVALAAALPTTGRPLTWLDGATVAAALAALSLLYSAAEGLLAEAPRSTALLSRVEAAHG